MNSGPSESREVPVDVLPPLPKYSSTPPPTPPPTGDNGRRLPLEDFGTFYHPASGVVILALDWLLFGTDLATGFLALPVMCVLGFIVTFALVLLIQQNWSRDRLPHALGKAFIGAFLVGLPFPITGTLLGAAILILSGLPHHPVEAVRRLATSASAKL
jgi:hypothetical protein